MADLAPGQRWTYSPRPGEETSTLLIVGRDEGPGGEVGYSVRLEALQLRNPWTEDGLQTELVHVPLTESALRESLSDRLETGVTLPDDGGAYASWRASFERGEAGCFSEPVAQVVQIIEDLIVAPSTSLPTLFQKANQRARLLGAE